MIVQLLREISTTWTLALAAVAAAAFLIVYFARIPERVARVLGYRGCLSVWAIDGSINRSPETIHHFLDEYGEAGRKAVVVDHLIFDYLTPLAVALFLGIGLSLIGEQLFGSNDTWRWLTLIPFIGCLSDWLENVGIITMARVYPGRLDPIARATGVLTIVKFYFDLLAVSLLLLGGIALLMHRPISG